MDSISLCIPYIEGEYSSSSLNSIFKKLDIGPIKRIDIVPLKTNKLYQRGFIRGLSKYTIFIHFYHWNRNDDNERKIKQLSRGRAIYVSPELGTTWKCVKLKNRES